jgi:hypothetical protein
MMEKYSQPDSDQLLELRNEESSLMQKMSTFMSGGEKTAALEMQRTEQRLQSIRHRITQLDLAKGPTFGK